jgi:hypothetical protein
MPTPRHRRKSCADSAQKSIATILSPSQNQNLTPTNEEQFFKPASMQTKRTHISVAPTNKISRVDNAFVLLLLHNNN